MSTSCARSRVPCSLSSSSVGGGGRRRIRAKQLEKFIYREMDSGDLLTGRTRMGEKRQRCGGPDDDNAGEGGPLS